MSKFCLLLLLVAVLATAGCCCSSNPGSREFIPGQGWVPTQPPN